MAMGSSSSVSSSQMYSPLSSLPMSLIWRLVPCRTIRSSRRTFMAPAVRTREPFFHSRTIGPRSFTEQGRVNKWPSSVLGEIKKKHVKTTQFFYSEITDGGYLNTCPSVSILGLSSWFSMCGFDALRGSEYANRSCLACLSFDGEAAT